MLLTIVNYNSKNLVECIKNMKWKMSTFIRDVAGKQYDKKLL